LQSILLQCREYIVRKSHIYPIRDYETSWIFLRYLDFSRYNDFYLKELGSLCRGKKK